MAVYTEVTDEALAAFLTEYELGSAVAFRGIAEGVENSNFQLRTTAGDFILTLYEKRVDPAELPWFLGLMEHLAGQGISCPAAGARPRRRRACATLAGRPACITTFLPGVWPRRVRPEHCGPLGAALAQLARRRAGLCGGAGQRAGPGRMGAAARALPAARGRGSAGAWRRSWSVPLGRSWRRWPSGLPRGHIHADLFPDNVFFLDGAISGLIDFYFAATDLLAYDVAVCLNAWCFEPDFQFNVTKARALLRGYTRVRPLEAAERASLPVLCQGAALRFLLTRLFDWVNTPAGAMVTRKDPLEYARRLRFHMGRKGRRLMACDGPASVPGSVPAWSRYGPMAAASPTRARAAGRRSCASAAMSGSCRGRSR